MSSKSSECLLAVSGGMDSMALLHALLNLGFKPGVAYFDHLTREGESTQDGLFVKEYCNKHDLIFHSGKMDHSIEYSNFHNEAHKQRYAFFKSLGYSVIITAHHKDDLLETVLWQTFTGRDPVGMKGSSNNIHRPLMNVSRIEIEEYVANNKIEYVIDSSNDSIAYDRNFIRHKLVSELKDRFDNFDDRVLSLSTRWQSSSSLLSQLISNLDLIEEVNGRFSVTLEALDIYGDDKSFLLFKLISKFGFTHDQCVQMFVSKSGALFLSNSHKAVNKDRTIFIEEILELEQHRLVIDKTCIPCETEFNDLRFEFEWTDSLPDKFSSNELFIPKTKLTGSIVLRYWEQGDYFFPFGMNGNKQSLKKFFANLKIDRLQKHRIPLLLIDDQIAWIVNHRSDERFRCQEDDDGWLKVALI